MSGRYHAVSIRIMGSGCDAAKVLQNERYLSVEAPSLPLTKCSVPQGCRCRYRHHADRRQGARRDEDLGFPRAQRFETERRSLAQLGRRVSDQF